MSAAKRAARRRRRATWKVKQRDETCNDPHHRRLPAARAGTLGLRRRGGRVGRPELATLTGFLAGGAEARTPWRRLRRGGSRVRRGRTWTRPSRAEPGAVRRGRTTPRTPSRGAGRPIPTWPESFMRSGAASWRRTPTWSARRSARVRLRGRTRVVIGPGGRYISRERRSTRSPGSPCSTTGRPGSGSAPAPSGRRARTSTAPCRSGPRWSRPTRSGCDDLALTTTLNGDGHAVGPHLPDDRRRRPAASSSSPPSPR